MAGIQCPKRLYLAIRHPELATPPDASQQAIFDQGNLVGIEAQTHYPGGVLIDAPYNELTKALEQTEKAILAGANTLYEATFIHEGVLVRVDILHRKTSRSAWEIIEVKSSTEAKVQHVQDAAIQAWVLRGAGQKVGRVSVLHINNQFVYPDQGELFAEVDVTNQTEATLSLLPSLLASLREKLMRPEAPSLDIGPHCDDPYPCEFKDHCWGAKKIPELSVFDIPRLSTDRKWRLYQDGVIALDHPQLKTEALNETQRKMVEISNSGKRSVAAQAIERALSKWAFPLYFLDFETIGAAMPTLPGTRPYQQIPFQFSCHAQLKAGGPLLHFEYLHDQGSDPRPALIQALIDAIGNQGSVVAYNKGFEGACLSELAKFSPEHSSALIGIRDRLVDPLPVIREAVYDREFRGSFSIKKVAPALLGQSMSYEGMEVADGGAAQLAYARLTSGALSEAERASLKQAMLDYCRRDTIAMVNLVEWLRGAANGRLPSE